LLCFESNHHLCDIHLATVIEDGKLDTIREIRPERAVGKIRLVNEFKVSEPEA